MPPSKDAKASTSAPARSLIGYPIIEKLIETEDFSSVNKSMSSAYDTLEKMLKSKAGGLKKQKMIRQALQAYDLTIDLIRDLLKTKYEMIEKSQKKAAPQKK